MILCLEDMSEIVMNECKILYALNILCIAGDMSLFRRVITPSVRVITPKGHYS